MTVSESIDEAALALEKFAVSDKIEAPVFSLPNEIMAMVFECGCHIQASTEDDDADSVESDDEDFSDESCSSSDASWDDVQQTASQDYEAAVYRNVPFEVVVSHVCSLWRSTATATPQLWSNITVALDRHPEQIKHYIERSASYPLIVRFISIRNLARFAHKVDRMRCMIDLLFDHISHWRRCSILVRDDRDYLALRLFSLRAPILQHLTLAIGDVLHPERLSCDTQFTPQILTAGAPALAFVRLGGIAIKFFRPPLSNLTTLHLELEQPSGLPLSYQRFSDVVTASPYLAHLSVYGEMIGDEPWPRAQLIPLPALRSLRLRGLTGAVYCGVLLGISAPELCSLVLKDVIDPDLYPLWETMAPDKFPRLSSLTFFDFELAPSTYRHLFSTFPHISTFNIWQNSSLIPPVLLRILSCSNTLPTPWPCLEVFSTYYSAEHATLLPQMVKARRSTQHPLEKIRILTANNIFRMPVFKHIQVNVERLKSHDQWPNDLCFVDEDDQCFV